MPAVARLGDKDSDGNTISSTQENTNVFANNILVARETDILSNTDGDPLDPSVIKIVTGSPNVFVHNKAIARVGDLDNDHGATIAVGSPTVSANS